MGKELINWENGRWIGLTLNVEIEQASAVIDEYANTSSAGTIIAFHTYSDDFINGETGLICSFGARYSAGALFVRRVE